MKLSMKHLLPTDVVARRIERALRLHQPARYAHPAGGVGIAIVRDFPILRGKFLNINDLPGALFINGEPGCVERAISLWLTARDLHGGGYHDFNSVGLANDQLIADGYVFEETDTVQHYRTLFHGLADVCAACFAPAAPNLPIMNCAPSKEFRRADAWDEWDSSNWSITSSQAQCDPQFRCTDCKRMELEPSRCYHCFRCHYEPDAECIFGIDVRDHRGCDWCKTISSPEETYIIEDNYWDGTVMETVCKACILEENRRRAFKNGYEDVAVREGPYSREINDPVKLLVDARLEEEEYYNGLRVAADEGVRIVDRVPAVDPHEGLVHHIGNDGEVISHREPEDYESSLFTSSAVMIPDESTSEGE